MKKQNQLAILKMAAEGFQNDPTYTTIIGIKDDNYVLDMKRDFINVTFLHFTAEDVLKMSLENNGDVFEAILKKFSKASREQTGQKFANM